MSTYIPLVRIRYGQDSEKGLKEHNNNSCTLHFSQVPSNYTIKAPFLSECTAMHSLFSSSRSMHQYSQILLFPHKLYITPIKKKKRGEKWGSIHKQYLSLKRKHPVWLFRVTANVNHYPNWQKFQSTVIYRGIYTSMNTTNMLSWSLSKHVQVYS